MSVTAVQTGRRRSTRVGARLGARLRDRHDEIEAELLDRASGVSSWEDVADVEYVAGLRNAVRVALEYGLAGIERGGDGVPPDPLPGELLAQARRAARAGIGLDTVVRRYAAGHSLLGDFLMQEAERLGLLGTEDVRCVVRGQAARFDHLIEAISEEHRRSEAARGISPRERRRCECVDRLLAGELIGGDELAYGLDAWHVGLVATGPRAEEAIRDLASTVDRLPLLLDRGEGTYWAWLGGRRPLPSTAVFDLAESRLPADTALAIGEPAEGRRGWRLTHRQAQAVVSLALQESRGVVRYADAPVVASLQMDSLARDSLRQLFLMPLSADADGGATLSRTLRAYFAADRNSTAAAAALNVTRQTIGNRLRTVEQRLGRRISSCAIELEAALRLDELGLLSSAVEMADAPPALAPH